ncbi:hypothetical protein Kfla_4328 [Kribbella flavida DSM 17836]|uniref:Uncharacterized protein n=1 Tax=Kribbella flavida (strain DSM 17836 / JCM 10339 / NBRC 14399) TaxID=479435 RepID=D2PV81_KRIFD|nr:hypothetical protein Kfla_4328 [Kribbella flavida DSM 17836]
MVASALGEVKGFDSYLTDCCVPKTGRPADLENAGQSAAPEVAAPVHLFDM